jgi:putrescine transport system substrate-binding protein
MLLKVRRYIKYFHSSQNIDDLAKGRICVAMGWSGDMYIARDRAEQANQGVEVKYVIPKEGAMVWIDSMAIPADAPHPVNALKFLNFILKPEINAAIVNNVWYASADAAATRYVSKDIANDPSIYPPPEVKQKLFSNQAPTADYARLQKRAFTKLTTGE